MVWKFPAFQSKAMTWHGELDQILTAAGLSEEVVPARVVCCEIVQGHIKF